MPIMSEPVARHILTCAQSLAGGGVERVQLRLAADWIEAGRRVTLLLGSADGPLAAEMPPGIEIVSVGGGAYYRLFAMPRHVAALQPDLIFCPGNHYTSFAAWTRLRLGAACPPIVAKASNAFVRSDHNFAVSAGYRLWLRQHPRFIDHLVALSPALADEATAMMRLPADRVSVIANPPARYRRDPEPPPLPESRFILGVGRLEPQKRWDRLIAALARLADRTVHLVILGEGSARAALADQIAALGLGGRVSLPGHVLDPRPAIGRAALVALTSDFEGAPGVLREALAHGTPVVATDASMAVREIVHTPALGDVIPADDDAALIAALDRRLAPGAVRPAPVPEPGAAASAAYLDLFDRVVQRTARSG
jgi:glycosyltransferase involved in cell wall biosynthesis